MAAHYDTDFHAWAFEQARRLRAGEPVDAAHRRSRFRSSLQHLLKCEFQPEKRDRKLGRNHQVAPPRVNRLLAENQSLRPLLPTLIADGYQTAVTFASVETGT